MIIMQVSCWPTRDKTTSLRPPGYISSECPSIVSKACGVSDQMDFDNMSATHPLVPTVPETVHADVKAYTKRKCSSENGSNENAWMCVIELHTTHEPRRGSVTYCCA